MGKSIKDIPIDKIYEGMRVAVTNKDAANAPIALGRVLLVAKDVHSNFGLSEDGKSYVPYGNKINKILFKFDNGCTAFHDHIHLSSVYYVEENK